MQFFKKVLFIGGCHVEGYPVDAKSSFVSVCMKDSDAQTRIIAMQTVSKYKKIFDIIESEKPDLVVLQLGHYETGLGLKKQLTRFYTKSVVAKAVNTFRLSPRIQATPIPKSFSSLSDEPAISRNANLSALQIVQIEILKLVVASVFLYKLFDNIQFDRDCRDLFGGLRSMGVGRVIVLQPFCCLSPLTNIYRRKAWKIMKAEAVKTGMEIFETDNLFQCRGYLDRRKLYVDRIHINAEGHKLLGLKLRSIIHP